MNDHETILGVSGIAGIVVTLIYGISTYHNTKIRIAEEQSKIRIAEEQSKLPKEYWIAQKAESEASVQKHAMDVEFKERMELDSRRRHDAQIKAQMEFEKNAPDGYWLAKVKAEEESTIRKELQLHHDQMKRQMKMDEEVAKQNAQALQNSARSMERAIRSLSNDS